MLAFLFLLLALSANKLADPVFRRERARKAAIARTSIDHLIQKLVDAAPPLTEAQRARLAALLRPTVDGGDRP